MSQKTPPKVFQFPGTRPDDLPDPQEIITECLTAYKKAWAIDKYHLPRGIPLSNKSAFVKFGNDIELREAEIQDFVFQFLSTRGRGNVKVPRVYSFIVQAKRQYMVMELIDGSICDETHVPQIARALEELITIQAPTMAPGPVKPGPIDHWFFRDGVSSVTYPSVFDLQRHLNRILAKEGLKDSVDLLGEVSQHGLCLCPADMNEKNFMIDSNGMIVAIDFGQTSFLPPCFFHYAIAVSNKPFVYHHLGREVAFPKYPSPTGQLDALENARYFLFMSSNNYALPDYLRPKQTQHCA